MKLAMNGLCILLLACQSSKTGTDTAEGVTQDEWPSCGEFADLPIQLSPDEVSTQIHPDLLFSDGQFWMSYNLPNEQGKFEVWLQAFDCEGTKTFGPERVSVDADVNHTVSRIASSGDSLMLIWQSDDGSGTQNLSIRYRLLSRSTGAFGERMFWSPFPEGTSEILNAWMPAIDSFEGGFWITGAVAYSDYFSIVAQSLDDSGQLLADPVLISPAERASYYPSIAAKNDAEFGLSYEAISGANIVHSGAWSNGSFAEEFSVDNAAASDVFLVNGAYQTAMHYNTAEPTIYLDQTELGTGSMTHTPSVSVGESGYLLSHYGIISGFQNSLNWIWLSTDGSIQNEGVVVEDPPAAPYKSALTHIGGDRFMVVWAGGQSPDFMLYAKLIDPEL